MTELERHLTKALQELSAQYAREQRQQAEQIKSLARQVQQLDAHVTALAQDYKRIADALSGRSR